MLLEDIDLILPNCHFMFSGRCSQYFQKIYFMFFGRYWSHVQDVQGNCKTELQILWVLVFSNNLMSSRSRTDSFEAVAVDSQCWETRTYITSQTGLPNNLSESGGASPEDRSGKKSHRKSWKSDKSIFWGIFTINIIERIAQKLRRISLLHFVLVNF